MFAEAFQEKNRPKKASISFFIGLPEYDIYYTFMACKTIGAGWVTNHNIVSFQAIHAGWKAGIIQIVMESRRLHNIHPGIHKNETETKKKVHPNLDRKNHLFRNLPFLGGFKK